MKQLTADLWQTTLHRAGMLNTHAYFLQRPEGNILFYNTDNDNDLAKITELGGIHYQLLTHRDESGPSLSRIKEQFNAKLCCSALEAPIIGKDAPVDLVFEPNDHFLDNIAIIHTPGHTNGSICFFYPSPHGRSYLFTGDTIFQWDAKWATMALPTAGGSKAALAESLLKLRELNPSLVMSSGFVGDVAFVEMTGDEWIAVIDENVNRLSLSEGG